MEGTWWNEKLHLSSSSWLHTCMKSVCCVLIREDDIEKVKDTGTYCISLIRRLGVNQQIVCCLPGVKRSTGVNLNIEF